MVNVFITRMLIIIIVAVVAGWDTYLLTSGDKDAMFSVVIYDAARQWPVMPFVAGFLCGHVFWQVYSKSP